MKVKKSVIVAIAAVLAITCCAVDLSYADSQPTDQLKDTIDKIVTLLKNEELKKPKNKKERRTEIAAIISQRFDFEEMAKRSLAVHWNDRSPQEQKEFVAIFSTLLQQSYIGKIEAYTNETIVYDKNDVRGNTVSVYTTIKSPNVDIPIVYRMQPEGDKWWVYDVVIEGVSLVNTYRNQFNQIIRKESYTALLDRLKKKLKEIEAEDKVSDS